MTASIPASALANVIPGVLGAGGNPLSLNAVFVTNDPSIPIGTAQAFASAAAVSAWFGPNAAETLLANVYFAGFNNCTVLPGTLYYAQFNTAAVAGYTRGVNTGLSLAQLQALSDTGFTISINGVPNTSAAINLSGATSFTNAATLIQAALQSSTAQFSGTGSQAGNVVTISATASGQLAVGMTLAGAGVEPGVVVSSFGTYTVTAGTGTVNVTGTSGTVTSGSVTVAGLATVTFDTLRQAFVITSPTTGAGSTTGYASTDTLTTALGFTQAAGAQVSPGAAAATPASVMNSVVNATQNWATFMTVTEQTISNKEAFATWVQGTNQRYLYVCQDSSALPTTTVPATGSFGQFVLAGNLTGVMPVYDTTGGTLAAFQCAIAASTNYNAHNGRTTFAFRGQSGIAAQVTSQQVAANLVANGYNFYGAYATANQLFTMNQPGSVSGPFQWADTYLGQIWLNAAFQLALMNLLATVKAVPYVTRGYNLIRSALVGSTVSAGSQTTTPANTGPIGAALNFGLIVAGVTLSGTQAAALNSAANDTNAAATIQSTGWYLQILDPGAIVRGGRGTPVINFWYTDGGSVQQISMSSIDVL